MIGFRACRDCGKEVNVVDLTGGLCWECQLPRAARLSDLQRRYEAARRGGGEEAPALAGVIREYQTAEGVRLRAVAPAYRVE